MKQVHDMIALCHRSIANKPRSSNCNKRLITKY